MDNPNLIFKSILSFFNPFKPCIIKGNFETVICGRGHINVLIAFLIKHRSPNKLSFRRLGNKSILTQQSMKARGAAAPNKFFVGVLNLKLVRAFGGR